MTQIAPTTKNKKKSAGRIGAVQSLYSSKVSDMDITKVLANFVANGSMVEMDGIMFPADNELHQSIVSGVLNRHSEICEIANGVLNSRPIEKQDILMGYIIKAGIFELLENTDVDGKLIVNEYSDIAHSFYEAKEANLVNAVLDNLNKAIRE
ncbi:MAG: transcription antitermination protein NusB [Alphaproteobacteria bacterium]